MITINSETNSVCGFREQGNKRKIKLGTWEQKHILGNREHQNRRILLGNSREHKENFVGNKGTWTPWEGGGGREGGG